MTSRQRKIPWAVNKVFVPGRLRHAFKLPTLAFYKPFLTQKM